MLDFYDSSPEDFRDFGRHLWQTSRNFNTHEQVSQFIASSFYEEFSTSNGDPQFALVRIYRLTALEDLPSDLRKKVDQNEERVFALTGTYGLEDAWCDRQNSVRHQVVPLSMVADPEERNMFQEMLRQLGVDMDRFFARHELSSGTNIQSHVYVAQVPGYPAIPDQNGFVKPYGIQSLIGFGGFISGGHDDRSMYLLFAFSREAIPPQALEKTVELPEFIGAALASRESHTGVFNE